ncbi:MAG: choice-of-anchor J domain-containing protein [Candidatus Onthomorpha sp.]
MSITVGTGTMTSPISPIPGAYGNHSSLQLFSTWEIGQPFGCVIDSISLELGDVTQGAGGRAMRIYMKEVDDTTVASTHVISTLTEDAILVYSSVDEVCSANTWHTFALQTPFIYSGAGSLMLIFEGEGCTTNGGCSVSVKYDDAIVGKGWIKCWDSSNPIDLNTPVTATTTFRTNTRLYVNTSLPSDFCRAVTDIVASNVTASSVNLSWTSEEASFEYMYKEHSQSWDADEVVSSTTSSNSLALSNLTAGTNYDFKVRAMCANEQQSYWKSFSFQTSCDVYSVPFEEEFDDAFTFVGGQDFSPAPMCWLNVNGDQTSTYFLWKSSTESHSGAGSAYYAETTAGSPQSDFLITPKVTLSGHERMHFYIKKYTATYPTGLKIYSYDLSSGDITSIADTSLLTLLDSVPSSVLETTDWYEYELNLSALSGTYRFALVPYANTGSLYVDEFSISALPSCVRPDMTSVEASAVGTDEATISWNDDNNSQWIVYYQPVGATTWETEYANGTSAVLTGLQSGTLYNVYVVAVCGGTESDPTYVSTFLTECDAISDFPWTEGFESEWNDKSLMDGTIVAPYCWYNINVGGYEYNCWQSTTISYEGNKAAVMKGYPATYDEGAMYKNDDWFISPVFELTGNEVLSFYTKKAYATYNPELRIYAYSLTDGDFASAADTSDFVLVDSLTNLTTDYLEYEVSLEGLVGAYRLALVVNNTYANGSIYLDNVSIRTAAACERPSGLVVTSRTDSEINIAWNTVEGASSYNVYYRTSDSEPWTVVPVTTAAYTLAQLPAATTYTIDVTAVCSDGNETGFTLAPSLLTATLCTPYTVPFIENFTTFPQTSSVTSCWAKATGDLSDLPEVPLVYGSSFWAAYTREGILSGSPHAKVRISKTGATSADKKEWLITPTIDLGDGSTEYDLKFSLAMTQYYSTNAPVGCVGQKFMVLLSQDGGITWDSIDALTWEPAYEGQTTNDLSLVSPSGQMVKVNLTELGYTDNVKIGFYAYQTEYVVGQDNDLHIDDVQIIEHVDCPDIMTINVQAVNTTSVSLNWDNSSESEAGCTVLYAQGSTVTPETPGVQTVNIPYGTELPYVLNGFTPGSTYTFTIAYDCGGAWSNPTRITLPATAASVPYTCDFDNDTENASWTLTNGSLTTKWFIGTETESTNGKLYVSSDNGATASYDVIGQKVIFAARNIAFGNAESYKITFDYKGGGEILSANPLDFVKVGVFELSEQFTAGTTLPTWTAATFVQEGLVYGESDITCFGSTEGTVQQGVIYVDGANVNNTVKQLVFAWRQNYNGGDGIGVQIDNISIVPINCPAPNSIELIDEGATTNSLTLDIDDENGSYWEIQYKAYEQENWQSVFTSNITNTISDLASGTMYKVRVRAICNEDTSVFVPMTAEGFISCATLCEVITVTQEQPFVENFDAPAWFQGSDITSADVAAPMCWININGKQSSLRWTHAVGTQSYGAEGGCLQMYSYTALPDTISDWFITPIFDLAGTESLSFFAKKGNRNETLKIMYYNVDENGDMTSGADTSNFQLLQTISVNSADYTPYDIRLSNLTGQYRLAFYASVPGNYLRIDEVRVHIPDCSRPQLTDFSITPMATTATVSITDQSNTAWIIYYKAEDDADYTVVPATSTEVQLTGLSATTAYEIYIVGDCGEVQSEPSATKHFSTRCFDNAITEFPYTEGFESGLGCWDVTFTSPDMDYLWTVVSSGYLPTCTPHGGSSMARYQSFNAAAGSTSTMISPAFDFSQDMQLSFRMYKSTTNPAANDRVEVYVNNSSSEQGATLLTSVTQGGDNGWQEHSVQLPEGLVGTHYIIIKAVSGHGANMYIDDITLSVAGGEGEPCEEPTDLYADDITQTEATITWNGEASSYEVRLNGAEAETITETSKTYTDLAPSTTYTVEVRAVCETGNSAWVSTTFTTLEEEPEITAPTVATLAATSVTHNSATLNGTITAGSEAITAQGFMYKATAENDWITTFATGISITTTVNGLTAETEYQFKAFATTASGTIEGTVMSFTTLAAPVTQPVVTTLAATEVTHNSATLNGTITAGTEAITAQGFMYKEATAADWTSVSATGETMSATVSGLNAETEYQYKAFATTASGTVEGEVMTFTTLAAPVVAPTVTTLAATEITHETATLNGTVVAGSEAISAQGFMYKATAAAEWTTVDAEGENMSAAIGGLTAETEYEYKAFATTASGTVEGEVITFTTLANSGLNSVEGTLTTMTVYPNPASQKATISVIGLESGAKIAVSDMQGRVILSDNMTSDTYELSVENLASGVYYIRVINGNTIHTQKLIVK